MNAPLIIGAGPAGCAAAITMARKGAQPVVVDRNAQAGDALCGGFMSWQTVRSATDLGIDLTELGAKRVDRLRLFAGDRKSESKLPAPAFGISRSTFDSALRRQAVSCGARVECDTIRALEPSGAVGARTEWRSDSVFLATGKSDLRGETRPRTAADPALGIRVRSGPSADLSEMVGDAIELHLFEGGYAGIILQENGSANICLAVRKSLLGEVGNDPRALLAMFAERSEQFAIRLGSGLEQRKIDTIGAIPYGWIASGTQEGLFRIGDQAAVIPSLAGEGINIALQSGVAAAESWLQNGPQAAPAFQHDFARKAQRPVTVARLLWQMGESHLGGRAMTALAGAVAPASSIAMRWSRLAA